MPVFDLGHHASIHPSHFIYQVMTSKLLSQILLSASVVASLLAAPAAFSQQAVKIAAVDMQKVFTEYNKTKKAEAELKDRAAGFDKELKDQLADLKKMQDDGRKLQEDENNPAYTDAKKAEIKKVVENKLQEFRLLQGRLEDLATSRKKDLQEQQNRIRSTIVDEISKVIQTKAKTEGYTLVIDKTGMTLSGVPPFIYVQDSLDITADIIKALNASAAATSSTPSAGDAKKTPDVKK